MDRKAEHLTALVKQHLGDVTFTAMSCQAEVLALKERLAAVIAENAELKDKQERHVPLHIVPPSA